MDQVAYNCIPVSFHMAVNYNVLQRKPRIYCKSKLYFNLLIILSYLSYLVCVLCKVAIKLISLRWWDLNEATLEDRFSFFSLYHLNDASDIGWISQNDNENHF